MEYVFLNERLDFINEKFSSSILRNINEKTKEKYGRGIKDFIDTVNKDLFVGISWDKIKDKDLKEFKNDISKHNKVNFIVDGYKLYTQVISDITGLNSTLTKVENNINNIDKELFEVLKEYDITTDFNDAVILRNTFFVPLIQKNELYREESDNKDGFIYVGSEYGEGSYEQVRLLPRDLDCYINANMDFLDEEEWELDDIEGAVDSLSESFEEIFDEYLLQYRRLDRINIDITKYKFYTLNIETDLNNGLYLILDTDDALVAVIYGDKRIKHFNNIKNADKILILEDPYRFIVDKTILRRYSDVKSFKEYIENTVSELTIDKVNKQESNVRVFSIFHKTRMFKFLNAAIVDLLIKFNNSFSDVNVLENNDADNISELHNNITVILDDIVTNISKAKEIKESIYNESRSLSDVVNSLRQLTGENTKNNNNNHSRFIRRINDINQRINSLIETYSEKLNSTNTLYILLCRAIKNLNNHGFYLEDYNNSKFNIVSRFAELTKTENNIKGRKS